MFSFPLFVCMCVCLYVRLTVIFLLPPYIGIEKKGGKKDEGGAYWAWHRLLIDISNFCSYCHFELLSFLLLLLLLPKMIDFDFQGDKKSY